MLGLFYPNSEPTTVTESDEKAWRKNLVSMHFKLTDTATLLIKTSQDFLFAVLMALEAQMVLKPFLTVNNCRTSFPVNGNAYCCLIYAASAGL